MDNNTESCSTNLKNQTLTGTDAVHAKDVPQDATCAEKRKVNSQARFAVADDAKIDYLERIAEKQLQLYNWCEEKVSTLATLDSILLALATIFLNDVKFFEPDTLICANLLNALIVSVLILPLFISLAIALLHIRPKMGKASNTGTPNHRSSNGIRNHVDKPNYKARLSKITSEEICDDLCNQIFGMNENIWKNQSSIKVAVILDIISLVGFFVVIVIAKLLNL